MVSQDLLDILACPSCKGDLHYDEQHDTLTCTKEHCQYCGMPSKGGVCQNKECGKTSEIPVGLRYRVEDDIPIMLIDEAEKLPLSS